MKLRELLNADQRTRSLPDTPASRLHPVFEGSVNTRGVEDDTGPFRTGMGASGRVGSETIAHLGAGVDRRVVARSMRAGLWIWPTFALLDAYMCFVAYPGAPFPLFVAYRIAVELAFLAVYRASVRKSTGLGPLLVRQSLAYCAAAFAIALMAIHLGGIRSPYMHGISLVALVWAALVPMPWRRGLPTFLGIGLAFPLVMAAGAAVSPSARVEWITAEALTVFASHYVFVVASSTLGVILSHMVWSAQQEARTLGSYELEGLLGAGGMGEVWRARHHLLARSAAIKVIRPEALGGTAETRGTAVARFEREARATASLRSPHTVHLYDFGISDRGAFYYVMELLEGLDAADLVRQFGPLPAGRVVYLLRQVCDSLGEAHAAGLVHRDVKPSNIHVCRYGRAFDFVKVLDFGLVKPAQRDAAPITADFVVAGTPAFMAPEQALGNRPVDARSDIYALGCVAYWLLTGQSVFEGTVVEILTGHAGGMPVAPSQRLGRPIPEALECLVMTCLEKDPGRRPESADAVVARLAGLHLDDMWTQEDARLWWQRHRPRASSSGDPTATV